LFGCAARLRTNPRGGGVGGGGGEGKFGVVIAVVNRTLYILRAID
jgi:hypothetical protein